jgi:AhpD family alkylhydroperoxidase
MSAKEAAADVLDEVTAKFGFVPNLIREMVKSPAVARLYLDGQQAMSAASLRPAEQQIVQLAVAVYNECPYCRAAHRRGSRQAGVTAGDIELVEKGSLPDDRRLRAVVSAAWQVLDSRGWLSASDLTSLEADGIDRARLYEVVALVGLKTISNYVNHIAHTPIDEQFAK